MSIGFSPQQSFTQSNRHLRVTTPLGDNVLLLRRFDGTEHISKLSHFELDLLSHRDNLNPIDIVGDAVSIEIEPGEDQPARLFHGYVKRFDYVGLEKRGLYAYTAEIVPWLWFLSKTTDCRVFQNKSVKDIAEFIFKDLGFTDYAFALSESHPPLEYCVQYNESDLDFISRLFEQEGIFYYIEHQASKHIVHICDSVAHYKNAMPAQLLHTSGSRDDQCIHLWRHQYQYCSGTVAQTDFDFQKYNHVLLTQVPTRLKLKNIANYPQFNYPGSYLVNDAGQALTKLRMQQEELDYEHALAASNVHTLEVGKKFSLKSDEAIAAQGKSYVITELQHRAYDPSYLESESKDPPYTNQFYCIPADVPYRPPFATPKPRIEGVQTAKVVGPSGEEIYTDNYGRIKVQFHWDRYGAKNETSSCWVRVSTPWAGTKWGSICIPRIGQEVVVTFLNGDPDQPLIIGSLYNSDHMPPYALPDNKTQMGTKSRSSKGGNAENFNEIRFEDKKGNEQIYVHAEKDYDTQVENDQTLTVDHDRTKTVKHDENSTINHDRNKRVDNHQTESIGKNKTIDVGDNHTETIGKNMSLSVGKNISIDIADNHTETIGKNMTIGISKDLRETVEGQYTETVTKDYSLKAKTITLNADDQITIKTGSASIVMKSNGDITISGANINVKGSGNIVMKGSKITQN